MTDIYAYPSQSLLDLILADWPESQTCDVCLWYWDSSKTSSRIVGINYLKRKDKILEREKFKSLYILNVISLLHKN